MYAMKQAVIAKEHTPGLDATIFYMDLRAFGKGFEEYYVRAQTNMAFGSSGAAWPPFRRLKAEGFWCGTKTTTWRRGLF
jgi:hypothetical protein